MSGFALPAAVQALGGDIYEDESRGRLLFTMELDENEAGGRRTVTRTYRDPEGDEQAREVYVYEGGELLQFRFSSSQTGASGVFRSDGETVSFEWTELKGRDHRPVTRDATEKSVPGILTADQVAPFLQANWDRVVAGGVVPCRYVVLHRRETVGFEFEKVGEAVFEGEAAVIVRMKPKSILIAALVDPLFFTLEEDPPHRVLALDGRVVPKVRDGDKWKDLDAFTVYTYGD